ncbi:uncharacterized protein GIQ15_00693 [Arthroderma uncinatum]|uniref:uncharacterized protein n=1 Tax=Arthroderma uncinatum TaxID=74035 RepID=UPI00144A88BC|nr:uncharacterized protein GIQ15_00693 [Arthroderma uncinatum]KAF3491176.1 hypothetical protein GIQ15_00693 [Arthroderma uncinatum]
MADIERLPLEVLEDICEFVASEDDWASLCGFSLTNRRFCDAANKQRFREIRFLITNRKELHSSVNRWNTVLESGCYFAYVRRLVLYDEAPVQSFESGMLEDPADENIDILSGQSPCSIFDKMYERNQWTLREEEAWEPLAQLISRLPGLTDLIYNYIKLFPQCLLDVLHRKLPRCRLHIYTFCLESLYRFPDCPYNIEPYEYTLATSPNLYSIFVPHFYFRSPLVDHNYEAALLLASGLAPNLKEIYLKTIQEYPLVNRSVPRPTWHGFFPDRPQPTIGFGKIEKLGFSSGALMDNQGLEAWNNNTSFSQLRTLVLKGDITMDTFKLAGKCEFNSLETLALDLSLLSEEYDRHELDATGSSFLKSLSHPLKSLNLPGSFSTKTLQAVLDSHGSHIQRLRLSSSPKKKWPFTLSAAMINKFSLRCLKLEEFTLIVDRTMGSQDEIAVYRALGTLAKLKHLVIYMDFWGPQIDGSFNHGMMINSAIDRPLAQSIFHTIITAADQGKSALRSLKIHWNRARYQWEHLRDREYADVALVLQRHWLCTRSRDGSGKLHVKELGSMKRERIETINRHPEPPKAYEETFRDLWPKTRAHWSDDWYSFPLQLGQRT